mmetsp:Transcript_30239/g.66308  ORF Transcript_30239/g.66308 Transcript_30239/m.66308 type:complete len:702 (-) Transcript_30239:612-2717(-)
MHFCLAPRVKFSWMRLQCRLLASANVEALRNEQASAQSCLRTGIVRLPATTSTFNVHASTRRFVTARTSPPPNYAAFEVLAALEARDDAQKLGLARLLEGLRRISSTRSGAAGMDHDIVGSASVFRGEPACDGTAHSICIDDEGLHVDLDSMTTGVAMDTVTALTSGSRLHAATLLKLMERVTALLMKEPTLVDLRSGGTKAERVVTVVGDLHGCTDSLEHVLALCAPSLGRGDVVVFNGDFVDRGAHGAEVLASLLLLKLAHPRSVVLLRGNHEDSMLASVYGFSEELSAKYAASAPPLWAAATRLFAALPLGARTAHALVLHGGIPNEAFTIRALEQLSPQQRAVHTVLSQIGASPPATPVESTPKPSSSSRPEAQPSASEAARASSLIQGVLWSDPLVNSIGFERNEPRGGAGSLFGEDVTRKFLEKHGLRHLVRSHQMVEAGWEYIDCSGGYGVYTVFSAASYPNGSGYNAGAVLQLRPRDESPVALQFELATKEGCGEAEAAKLAQQSMIEIIVSHKGRLREAFARAAPHNEQRVSIDVWAEVIQRTLNLHIDWRVLQPAIAPTVKRAAVSADGSVSFRDSGLIDYAKFLDQFTLQLARGEDAASGGRVRNAEALYAQLSAMRAVLELLDTDRSGSVSRAEFVTGVEMLNAQLPADQQLAHDDADKLFSAIDTDSSGEIELDELGEAFRVVTPATR